MAAFWMLVASFLFATMAVCVKIAAAWFSSAELVFYRGLVGMVFMAAWARRAGIPLATAYPGMHAWRSLVGVLSMGGWFYSIAYLPLPTALTLNYMSSVWIAAFLLGGTLLAWRPRQGMGGPARQGPLVLTVLAGFAGVVMMLRPTMGQDQWFAGVVGLLSGLTGAFAYMQVMALSRMGECDERVVFYFACGSTFGGAAAMAVDGVSPWNWSHALWLLPVGLLAALGQLCMTRAYRTGPTLVVANLQYSGLVMGALYGMVLFGDELPLIAWGGMALIIASGIAATVLRARTAPDAPAEEH